MLGVNLMLAMAWVILTGEFTLGNLAIGFGLGYFMLRLSRKVVPEESPLASYIDKVPQVVGFVGYFLWSIVLASFRMARAVLSPIDKLNPAIVHVPLTIENPAHITLLANWITLTPGTLTLEVSLEPSELFVHTFQCSDPEQFRREIQDDFERRIIEVFN